MWINVVVRSSLRATIIRYKGHMSPHMYSSLPYCNIHLVTVFILTCIPTFITDGQSTRRSSVNMMLWITAQSQRRMMRK